MPAGARWRQIEQEGCAVAFCHLRKRSARSLSIRHTDVQVRAGWESDRIGYRLNARLMPAYTGQPRPKSAIVRLARGPPASLNLPPDHSVTERQNAHTAEISASNAMSRATLPPDHYKQNVGRQHAYERRQWTAACIICDCAVRLARQPGGEPLREQIHDTH